MNGEFPFGPPGLECPDCGCPESTVVWTRHRAITHRGQRVSKTIRRRECAHCGGRFRTTERVTQNGEHRGNTQ